MKPIEPMDGHPATPRDGAEADEALLRLVRRALEVEVTEKHREGILQRIGGRSPRQVADDLLASRLRRFTAAAAVLLAALSLWSRDVEGGGSARFADEVQISSVIEIDPDDTDRAATVDGVVSDLFTLELPE